MALLPPQMREQFETAQSQLQKTREAESLKEFNEYAEGKPYIQEIMPDIAAEMRTLRQKAPGLDGKTILRLAHDNVVERNGMKSRLDEEAKAEQEGCTAQAQAERLKEMEAREKAQREENDQRVKAARRAAGINVKSSPGHSNRPKTLDDDLRAIANGYTADDIQKGAVGQSRRQETGTRNKTTVLLEALLDGKAEALTKKAIKMAQGPATLQ